MNTTDHDLNTASHDDTRALISDRDLDALATALVLWEVARDSDGHDDEREAA